VILCPAHQTEDGNGKWQWQIATAMAMAEERSEVSRLKPLMPVPSGSCV